MDDLTLASEFPPARRDDWLALVAKVLKDAPFERLVAKTYDGLAIEPLYARAAEAEAIAGRTAGTPWEILQRVDHPDPAAANAQALQDLENGATGLTVVFAGSIGAYGYGLPTADALVRALEGVHLDAGIAIDVDLSPQTKEAPFVLAELLKAEGIAPSDTNIRFGFDPIGALASQGSSPLDWPELTPLFAQWIGDLAGRGFKGPFAAADGRVIHNAGGSEAQELAFVLATGVAYLRVLEAGGIALDDATRMIFFRLSADADQFLTMAKFRALRKLWARIEEASGLAPAPIFIFAETAWRMMTQRDPYVNMLRATVATVAAGLGGADAVTVLPFTAAIGLPDRFARRIARNTQLILLEESNLAKVADPAAGAGGIEDLTAKLCATAWSLFQEIERAGGAWPALTSGMIQKQVAAVRAEREKAVAHRTDALTGTNEFPDLNEVPADVIPVTPVEVEPLALIAAEAEKLPRIRLADPFERLRDAADAYLRKTGVRPKVFLANLGAPADFTERAMFAKNFFGAGGIEAVTSDGVAASPLPLPGEDSGTSEGGNIAASDNGTLLPAPSAPTSPSKEKVKERPAANLNSLVAAFKDSGAKLVCLCSSDPIYAAEAVEAAEALTAAGVHRSYVAGKPAQTEKKLRNAGINAFIYSGCDVLATLRAAHDILRDET